MLSYLSTDLFTVPQWQTPIVGVTLDDINLLGVHQGPWDEDTAWK